MTGPRAAAVALVAAHLALALHGATQHSAVFDEVAYPTAGYAYWTTGDYRLNPEHPPLLKLWTALPWLGSGLDPRAAPGWAEADQWSVGPWLLYGSDRSPTRLLLSARAMIAVLSAGLAWAVYHHARRLGGSEVAGLAALALYAFDPLVVAHAGFATTDVGAAATLFVAAMALPEALARRAPVALALAGLACGVALASKFTALVLPGVGAAIVLYARATRARGLSIGSAGTRLALVLGIAAVVVAACYGPAGPWRYVEGLRLLETHARLGHPTYAFGCYGTEGWWWYFPAAWAIKTPIPILALSLAGIGIVLARRPRLGLSFVPLLLTPTAIVAATIASSLNLGVRHLLPAVPFLAVMGGIAAAAAWERRRAGRIAVLAASTWLVAGTLLVHPDETAYANEAAGGPDRTWTMLADSNVDWGQDLPALAEAVGRHPLRRLYLAYHGTADPAAHGLRYVWISSTRMIERRYEDGPDPAGREWIAISVTNLLEVGSARHDDYAWLRARPFAAFPGHSIALYDVTGDAEAHESLARIALRYGDLATAAAPLARAVELTPGDVALRVELVRVLRGLGRSGESAVHCEALRGVVPAGRLAGLCPPLLGPRSGGHAALSPGM